MTPAQDYEFRARFHGGRVWQAWLASMERVGQAFGGDLAEASGHPPECDDLLKAAEAVGLITRAGVHRDRNGAVRRAWWAMGYNDSGKNEPVRPIECVYVKGPNWRQP